MPGMWSTLTLIPGLVYLDVLKKFKPNVLLNTGILDMQRGLRVFFRFKMYKGSNLEKYTDCESHFPAGIESFTERLSCL